MITVRQAQVTDKDWIVNVAAKNMLELEVKRPEYFNSDHCGDLLEAGMKQGLILIAESDGVPVGCIAGMYYPNPFNRNLTVLQEFFWYVLPEYRRGKAGLCLLNAFCEIGKVSAHDVYMSLLESSEVNTRMMERKGFVVKEVAFTMKGIS